MKEKGITLIALVITIIVLIILAGVIIATLSGPNGILTQANEAKKRTEQANKEEQAKLADMEDLINTQAKGIYHEKQGVNKPKLTQGMIPIKWNGKNWVVCDENDEEWYDYVNQSSGVDGTSKWANVMLSDGTYKAESVEVGQVIDENDLGSMFVWIPRYCYQITSGYHSNQAGGIAVKFLVGRTNETRDNTTMVDYNEITTNKYTKFPEGYVVHPAFTFGEKELLGIWVAKFEASNKNQNVKLLPGKQSWRYITISNCFTKCLEMNEGVNASYYGVNSDKNIVDPHLMKNSEWGAIAYLTQSSYGRNANEVTPNTNGYNSGNNIVTGYAGNNTTASNSWTSTTPPTNVFYYNTKEGALASTTGNITGIYDLSGGSWEYIASYVSVAEENITNNGLAIYQMTDLKYKEVYQSAETVDMTTDAQRGTANYAKSNYIFGNAIWETSLPTYSSSWFNDGLGFPSSHIAFSVRGGSYDNGRICGLFHFGARQGDANSHTTFRPILTVY